MASTLAFNPYGTSQPQDSFLLQTQGLMQGLVYEEVLYLVRHEQAFIGKCAAGYVGYIEERFLRKA